MKKSDNIYSGNYIELLNNSNHFPVLNNYYLSYIDVKLTNKTILRKKENVTIEVSDYPNFKFITVDDIINLRLLLHLWLNEAKLENWCVKLLRYVEINFTKLKKNEKSYGRSREESILIFQQIKALFVEYFLKHHDLIYLNTAIKITDLEWIKTTAKTSIPVRELNNLKNRQIDYILQNLINE